MDRAPGGRHRAQGPADEPPYADIHDAVAEDRRRIARDLHDLVAQRLFATGLQLRQALVPGLPEPVATRIEATLRELDLAGRDLRAVVNDLRQPPGSLPDRVRDLTAEYAGVLGLRPTISTAGAPAGVPEQVADHLLLVLREALSNVARHAGATTCAVEVAASPQWVLLRVVDDGRGMPASVARVGGLRSLRERADALGGVLRMRPADPRGTCLEWLVPAR